jgi:hypothetical protein
MRVFKKLIGCIDGILIKVCAFVSRYSWRFFLYVHCGQLIFFPQIKCPGTKEVGKTLQ